MLLAQSDWGVAIAGMVTPFSITNAWSAFAILPE
jgi:hypothetical protein